MNGSEIEGWLAREGDKLLVCESVKEANRWIRRNNRARKINAQGVTACTISDLAKSIVEKKTAFKTAVEDLREVKVIDDTAAANIVLEVLQDQNVQSECKSRGIAFIPESSIDRALASQILLTFHKLRLGKKKENAASAGQENGYRALLEMLLGKYEERLKGSGYYDRCTILGEALECIEEMRYSRAEIACLLPWERTYKENQFLKKLAGLPSGKNMTVIDMRIPDSDRKAVSYEFVRAYGAANEIRSIADEIEEREIPYGDVAVLYASQEHDSLIRTVFGERGIPYCMPAGRPALDNDYIDLLYRLLGWMKTGRVGNVESFLKRSGCLSLWKKADAEETQDAEEPEHVPDPEDEQDVEDEFAPEDGQDAEAPEDERDAEETQEMQDEQSGRNGRSLLPDAMQEIRSIYKEFSQQETVNALELLKVLEGFLKKYSKLPNPKWKTAKGCFDSLCDRYEGAKAVSFPEAVARLQEELKNTLTAEEERQDAVSLIPIGKRSVLDRGNNYIVGLSDYHFRDKLLDSAILPDEQVKCWLQMDDKYSADCVDKDYVELELDAEKTKQEHLTDTMQTLNKGRIVLSYSSYDSVNQKNISPSLYYLDIKAEKNGKEKEVSGYPLLSYNYVDHGILFPETEKAEEAETEKVPALSASGLNTMLVCPRRYYYGRILHIPEEEEKERDPGKWLDPLKKGTLIHGILEEYINCVLKDKEKPEEELNQAIFDEIFNEKIQATREELPCESEAVFVMERQLYKEVLKRYLSGLHKDLSPKWRVYQCEMRIGLDENMHHCKEGEYKETYEYACRKDTDIDEEDVSYDIVEEDADEEDVTHDLPAEPTLTVAYHGELDRVDYYKDEDGKIHFRIVDYKTGKQKNLKEELDCDLWPQHIIYARLLENRVKDSVVEEFVYECIFEKKEENKRIVYTSDQLKELPEYAQEVLVRTLADCDYGWHEPAEMDSKSKKYKAIVRKHESVCDYCAYKDMCREKVGEKI